MGFKHNHKRMNVDGDRLSNLSDDLIHKIFSSINTKLVVQTSVLSSRWRFIWTSMPYLNLSSQDFSTLPEFSKFVRHVLSGRNNKTEVSSVKLSFRGDVIQGYVKEIMYYAFCHNIQQLDVSYLIRNSSTEFPLSLFSSPSLKYLSLSKGLYYHPLITKSSWELPALTTLYLQHVNLCNDDNDGLFSKCANLKNLILQKCGMVESENFSISHPRLSNLTLDNSFMGKFVNVVAPKLENFTIRNWGIKEYVIKISAPDLTSFVYKGDYYSLRLSKEANIYVSWPEDEYSRHIHCLLQHLHSVKFLVLNLGVVKLLSSYVELALNQPFMFTNLKRLKICQPNKCYFLDSSPGTTLEIVAQNLMLELRVLLEQEKTNTKTDRTHMEQGKDPMESHNAKMLEQEKPQPETELQTGKIMAAKIKSSLRNLSVQIERWESKYCLINSKLQRIEVLLAKLPASNRAKIQTCFPSLRAETVIVLGGITHCMKTQCDEKQSRMSVFIQELATTLTMSS